MADTPASWRTVVAGSSFALALAQLVGCAGASTQAVAETSSIARITGTITYPERVALSPDALVKVQLVDVSRTDAPAVVLGEEVVPAAGRQVPIAFAIPYDPAKIEPRNTYALQVRIEEGGKLRFISDQRYAVITHGAPMHVDMVLKAVAAAPR